MAGLEPANVNNENERNTHHWRKRRDVTGATERRRNPRRCVQRPATSDQRPATSDQRPATRDPQAPPCTFSQSCLSLRLLCVFPATAENDDREPELPISTRFGSVGRSQGNTTTFSGERSVLMGRCGMAIAQVDRDGETRLEAASLV